MRTILRWPATGVKWRRPVARSCAADRWGWRGVAPGAMIEASPRPRPLTVGRVRVGSSGDAPPTPTPTPRRRLHRVDGRRTPCRCATAHGRPSCPAPEDPHATRRRRDDPDRFPVEPDRPTTVAGQPDGRAVPLRVRPQFGRPPEFTAASMSADASQRIDAPWSVPNGSMDGLAGLDFARSPSPVAPTVRSRTPLFVVLGCAAVVLLLALVGGSISATLFGLRLFLGAIGTFVVRFLIGAVRALAAGRGGERRLLGRTGIASLAIGGASLAVLIAGVAMAPTTRPPRRSRRPSPPSARSPSSSLPRRPPSRRRLPRPRPPSPRRSPIPSRTNPLRNRRSPSLRSRRSPRNRRRTRPRPRPACTTRAVPMRRRAAPHRSTAASPATARVSIATTTGSPARTDPSRIDVVRRARGHGMSCGSRVHAEGTGVTVASWSGRVETTTGGTHGHSR